MAVGARIRIRDLHTRSPPEAGFLPLMGSSKPKPNSELVVSIPESLAKPAKTDRT